MSIDISLCTASVFSEELNIFTIPKYTPSSNSSRANNHHCDTKIKTFTRGTVKQNGKANYLVYYTDTLGLLVITKQWQWYVITMQSNIQDLQYKQRYILYIQIRYCSAWLTESWRFVCLFILGYIISICNFFFHSSIHSSALKLWTAAPPARPLRFWCF